jgi:TetR/AcrR family transcriptional regulator, mexJK operon transcriptional repressor
MGAPLNEAMLLGDAAIPDRDRLSRHAEEAVQLFLAAYRA